MGWGLGRGILAAPWAPRMAATVLRGNFMKWLPNIGHTLAPCSVHLSSAFLNHLIHPFQSGNHGGKPRCGKRQKHSMADLVSGYAFFKRPPGV
jgi:hypothetical protein